MASLSEALAIPSRLLAAVKHVWHATDALGALSEYVRVPNLSPSFDADIHTNGLQERAFAVLTRWIEDRATAHVRGLKLRVEKLPGRTPLIFVDVAACGGARAARAKPVLMYAHADKQPPFEGWAEGLGPYAPVVRDGRLYGRGAADDGYGVFAALSALAALQREGAAHPRVVVLVEGSEESGSPDLPFYMERLQPEIGEPGLVVCLDSGAGSYDRLWVTSSLRGVLVGDLTVSLLKEGVHSGDASGVVPSTFRVARELLERLEDAATGEVKPEALRPELSADVRRRAAEAAERLGEQGMVACFPFLPGARPVGGSLAELALNRWWRAQVEVIGGAGIPPSSGAGNVLRPWTTLTLSVRLPPYLDKREAERCLASLFTEPPPPYGATVEFRARKSSQGWSAPPTAPWLDAALERASAGVFGHPAVFQGEGGTIPFMAMLGATFPRTQFLVTGVLGPGANAHGPNEFLHLDYCLGVAACVAHVVAAYVESEGPEDSGSDRERKRARPDELAAEFTRTREGKKE